MANHTNHVPEWLDKHYMDSVVKLAIDPKLTVKKIEVSPGSSIGDNYICEIFRLTLHVERNNAAETLSVIGKLCSPTTMFNEFKNSGVDVYETESDFLYTTSKKLEKHLHGRQIYPKCLYVDDEKKIIFMEDLKVQGFTLMARNKFLDLDHCLQTVRAHAAHHASSFLLYQEDPKLITKYDKRLWQKDLPEFIIKFSDHSFNRIAENIDNWKLSDKHRLLFNKVRERYNREHYEVCEYQQHDFNVLLHGDCWKNNMMYRYENNKVNDIRLIDFQLVMYSCFALDLQYFLSSSATQDVRYENIEYVLECYYEAFCKVAPNVQEFTFERVKREFEEKEFYGCLCAVTMRPLVVAQDGFDVDKILDGEDKGTMFASGRSANEVVRALDYFENIL